MSYDLMFILFFVFLAILVIVNIYMARKINELDKHNKFVLDCLDHQKFKMMELDDKIVRVGDFVHYQGQKIPKNNVGFYDDIMCTKEVK